MSLHIATVDGGQQSPNVDRAAARKSVIEAMADDLVAGTTNALDLTSESDVALYLFDTARYSSQAMRLYTAAATMLAVEIIMLAKMGLK